MHKYLLAIMFFLCVGCEKIKQPFTITNAFGMGNSLEIQLPYDIQDSTSILVRGGHPPIRKTVHHLNLFEGQNQVGAITVSFQEVLIQNVEALLNPYYSMTSEFQDLICNDCLLLKSLDGAEYLLVTESRIASKEGSIFYTIIGTEQSFIPIGIRSCAAAVIYSKRNVPEW